MNADHNYSGHAQTKSGRDVTVRDASGEVALVLRDVCDECTVFTVGLVGELRTHGELAVWDTTRDLRSAGPTTIHGSLLMAVAAVPPPGTLTVELAEGGHLQHVFAGAALIELRVLRRIAVLHVRYGTLLSPAAYAALQPAVEVP